VKQIPFLSGGEFVYNQAMQKYLCDLGSGELAHQAPNHTNISIGRMPCIDHLAALFR